MKIFGTDYAYLLGRSLSELQGIDCIYFRSDNALVNSGKSLYLSSWMQQIHCMPHLVVRISRVGRGVQAQFADRYYTEVAYGFSLFDAEVFRSKHQAGLNPMLSYSFDGALMVGQMMPKTAWHDTVPTVRRIGAGGEVLPVDEVLSMPTDEEIRTWIALLSEHFLLKMGDLVTLPLWHSYIPLERGQYMHLSCGDDEMLFMGIK